MFTKKQMINLLVMAAIPSMIAAAIFGVCAMQADGFVGPSGETWYDPFSWYGDETRTQVLQGVRATFTVAAFAAAATALAGLVAARHQSKVYSVAVQDTVIGGYHGLARRTDLEDIREEIRSAIADAGLRRGTSMPAPEAGAPKGSATSAAKEAELDKIEQAVGG